MLSRALEAHGRPVAFVFEGEPPQPDGSELVLKPALLRKSVNLKSMAAGHAYPRRRTSPGREPRRRRTNRRRAPRS
jgi:hypothetical protein